MKPVSCRHILVHQTNCTLDFFFLTCSQTQLFFQLTKQAPARKTNLQQDKSKALAINTMSLCVDQNRYAVEYLDESPDVYDGRDRGWWTDPYDGEQLFKFTRTSRVHTAGFV